MFTSARYGWEVLRTCGLTPNVCLVVERDTFLQNTKESRTGGKPSPALASLVSHPPAAPFLPSHNKYLPGLLHSYFHSWFSTSRVAASPSFRFLHLLVLSSTPFTFIYRSPASTSTCLCALCHRSNPVYFRLASSSASLTDGDLAPIHSLNRLVSVDTPLTFIF